MDAQPEPDRLMSEDEFTRRFFETDLADLPSGPTGRHPALMVAVMVFSAALMWLFWEDTRYWLEAPKPVDIGDTIQWRRHHQNNAAYSPDGLRHNSYVRVAGLTTFRTEATGARQAFLKMSYVPILVHLRDEAPSERTDMLVHLTVSGRLLDLTRTSRYSGVQRFYAERFGVPTRRAYMLVAEDRPGSYWWTLALQALFGSFILANGVMLARSLRR